MTPIKERRKHQTGMQTREADLKKREQRLYANEYEDWRKYPFELLRKEAEGLGVGRLAANPALMQKGENSIHCPQAV